MKRLIIGICAVIALAGCSSSATQARHSAAASTASAPAPITVTGRIVIEGQNSVSNNGEVGETCTTAGNAPILASPTPFDDVKEGAQVVITDASGTTIGTTTLQPGKMIDAIDGGSRPNCAFSFTAADVKAGQQFYGIKVANQPAKQFSAKEIIDAPEIDLGG